jgi:tRNA(Ile)-lysidine synthase
VRHVAPAHGASAEAQARNARLAALEAEASADEWIVTGHHADDVAETVLGNLVRGAGARGLAGMAPARGRYVRPLLELPGLLIRQVAADLELPATDDPANADEQHRRVVLRRRVLPALEAALGADVGTSLVRAGRLLAADDAALEAMAEDVPVTVSVDAVLIPAAVLTSVPSPVAARAVRRALRRARPPYPGTAREVASVLAVASGGPATTLADGLQVAREGPMVALFQAAAVAVPTPLSLAVPGSQSFGAQHSITATVADRIPRPRPIGRRLAFADVDVVGTRLTLRTAASGERIDIGGGSKLVRDAMAEGGVPYRLRATWPVVEARGRIVWVAGVRLAAWAAPTDATGRVLLLSREGPFW